MTEVVQDTAKKANGILSKKVLGIPVLYIAIVLVGALALYAWRARTTTADEDIPTEDEATYTGEDGEPINPGLYPISPTGTVYAQSPQAVEDNNEYFGNNEWLQKAVAGMVAKGKNPGEVQNALQAYLEGEDLTYPQGQLRDEAIKEYGLPPESFRAGVSAGKPVAAKPTPPPAVKPVVVPKPAPPKPVVKPPAPKPQRTHKVVRGDTLWDLAGRYYGNTSKWPTIANKNGIRNPKTLQIGKVLVIP